MAAKRKPSYAPAGSPRQLAEDVLQESWISILQSVDHACFEGPKACPWLHRIVANTAENVRLLKSRLNSQLRALSPEDSPQS